MKKLPLGIETFSKLIKGNHVYVDKTVIALDLIDRGSYYFLSRPRRFGKSLFLSTLKEIFQGNRALFEGLYIYDKWDFDNSYPVIHISLGTGFTGTIDSFDDYLKWVLEKAEKDLGIQLTNSKDAKACFQELIWQANEKYKQPVVILIDEYDKPILDCIVKHEKAKARAIRDQLKEFYSVIKSNDAYLRFVFLTGVSKFSKMSLFSGLNNLEDITIDARYGNICGYTHEDLKIYFQDHLVGIDLAAVKEWYNGYNYFGDKVYNPYDILLFINKGFEFKNYWWQTGMPTFLIDLLKEKNYHLPSTLNYIATDEILNSFDVDTILLEAILWQTGYLTIDKKIAAPFGMQYELKVPNKEIQTSLTNLFITHLTSEQIQRIHNQRQLVKVLQNGNTGGLKDSLFKLFASIPYHNFTNNKIANYEGYYASVLYAYLASLGYPIIPEDITNKGRVDLTLQLPDKTYIFEFKVVEQATNEALQQIKTKQYYQKYQSAATEIYLTGIEFGKEERNIVHWEAEQI